MIIVEAERMTREQPTFGQGDNLHLAEFNKPIGRVYHPDSSVTENVTKVLVVRRPDNKEFFFSFDQTFLFF
jgi:ribosomal protein S8E